MTVISTLTKRVFVALLAATLVGASGCGSPVAPTGAERLRPAPSESAGVAPSEGEKDDGAGGTESADGSRDTGSNGEPKAGGGGGGAGGGDTGGGDGGGSAEAQQRPDVVVSPLRIPLPTDQLQGSNFFVRLPELEQLISDACGGSQCISVARVGEDPTLDPIEKCDTIRRIEGTLYTEANEAYLMVRPGGVITVVVNIRCEDVPPPPETPTGPKAPPEEQPSPEQPAPDPPPPEQSPPQEQAPPSGETATPDLQ